MARIVVNSNKSDGVIKKLVYQTWGQYTIIDRVSLGTYDCMKYGKLNGTIKEFRTKDLSLLPPAIFSCEFIDSPDLRYLNIDFAPLHHPLAKDFNIKAFNTRPFDEEPTLTLERLLSKLLAISDKTYNILALSSGAVQAEYTVMPTDIIPALVVNPSPI